MIMDAEILRNENEIREPLEDLGMEFHVYHDWALTQSRGYFTVAKSKAEFLTAAFDLHFKKTVMKDIDRLKQTSGEAEKDSGGMSEKTTKDDRAVPEAKKKNGRDVPEEETKDDHAVPEEVRKRLEEIQRNAKTKEK